MDHIPFSPVDAPPADGLPRDDEVLPRAASSRRRKNRGAKQVLEWVLLIVGALAIALLIKFFLFQAFYIPSESMVPTLQKNDRVLVNKLSYKFHDVHRGDIIVFEAPEGVAEDVKDLVKRVIGLPGDVVEGKNGHVFINGEQLEEDYLPEGTYTSDFGPKTVPPDSYWVMGDNRPASRDSRYFEFIPEDDIVGRVFVRILPPTRIGFM